MSNKAKHAQAQITKPTTPSITQESTKDQMTTPTENVAVATATAEKSETGIIVASGTSVPDYFANVPADAIGRKFLSVLPPKFHADLAELRDPTPNDLTSALAGLSDRERRGFEEWMRKMNPRKIGFHGATSAFRVPDLRIYQGSGTDNTRPATTPKGGTYDSDGNMVTAPGQAAMMLGIPERFTGIVIGRHATRQMWPPKDEQGNLKPIPSIKEQVNPNRPLCRSMDQEFGTRWGDCSQCYYKPFGTGQYRKDECKDEYSFYVVRYDLDEGSKVLPFSTIYRIPMASTSVKTGAGPINQRTQSWPQLWTQMFVFETVLQSKGNAAWYAWKTSVAVTAQNPQGVPTSPGAQRLLELLARKIDAAIYYPGLAGVYAEYANGTELPENAADMGAIMGAVDPAANL